MKNEFPSPKTLPDEIRGRNLSFGITSSDDGDSCCGKGGSDSLSDITIALSSMFGFCPNFD